MRATVAQRQLEHLHGGHSAEVIVMPVRDDDLFDPRASAGIHRLCECIQICWLTLSSINQDLLVAAADKVRVRAL
eukprot:SAG11_NODE_1652_length_4509_cov_3.121088_5_plen_75_part_00